MILIADAGGTKTDWRLIDGQSVTGFQSAGFNLSNTPLEPFLSNLPFELLSLNEIKEVHFYAAGVTPDSDFSKLAMKLSELFHTEEVNIYPDTLAACRSAYGHSRGWLGLLGTGSGLVYYDGMSVSDRIPSLGYVLGDEGSGADLGRRLVKAFLRNQLSKKLSDELLNEYPELNENLILDSIYCKSGGNVFLSGFVPFLQDNQDDLQINQLLKKAFSDYMSGFFEGIEIEDNQIKMIGSVAYLFQDMIRDQAKLLNINILEVIQSPIHLLTKYHSNNG